MRARPAALAAPLTVLTLLGGLAPASAAGGGEEDDFVPPTVTVTLPTSQSGWFTGDTAFSVGVSDAGGVASVEYALSGATTGDGFLPKGGGSIPVTAEGSTWVTVTATDRAGNTGVGSAVAKIDLTAPTVSFASGLDGAVVPVGAELRLDVTCADAYSGISSCTGPVANGAALDTSTPGMKTVSVVALDRVGRTATRTATYQVKTGPFAVTGEPRVDGTLFTFTTASVTLPTITPEPTAVSYQWYADWGAIPGATGPTYDLPANAPARIFVQVVAERPGYQTLTLTSAPRVTYLSPWQSHTTHIEGTPTVGSVLTAVVDATPVPDSIVYTWEADGAEIGTGQTYQVRPEDVGKTIIGQATIFRAGYLTRYPYASVGPVQKGTLAVTGTAQVTGSPVVGQPLSALDPQAPAGATVSRQWLVGGAPVVGETAATFRPRPADAGQAVAVRTTVTAAGYETWSATSAPTSPVARATSSVGASAKVLGPAKGRTRKVRVVAVVSATEVVPTGEVTITRGSKVVGRGFVTAQGTVTITLRRQPFGTAKYVITYAGDAGTLPASTDLKVKIRAGGRPA